MFRVKNLGSMSSNGASLNSQELHNTLADAPMHRSRAGVGLQVPISVYGPL